MKKYLKYKNVEEKVLTSKTFIINDILFTNFINISIH